MNRVLALITLMLMLVSIMVIPPVIKAQGVGVTPGVSIRAGTYGLYNQTPTNVTAKVLSDGILTIIINRSIVTWLPDIIRLSLLFETDRINPGYYGTFLNVSNINSFQYPFGGAIDLTKEGDLYNINGTKCGNITFYDGGTIVVILIDLTKIEPLDKAPYVVYDYVQNKYIIYSVDLYNSYLRVLTWDTFVQQYAISYNMLLIFKLVPKCSDVVIDVYNSPAKYGTTVNVIVSLEKYFEKVKNITGIDLDISTSNYTNITIINYYNISEEHYIASYVNGISDFDGSPVFTPVDFILINSSTVNYTGIIDDFAPTEEDPNYQYLTSLYIFKVVYYHEIVNESENVNLTFTITANSTCASTTIGNKFLRIDASLEITPIDIIGTTDINPGDQISFTAHNVPQDYLGTPHYVTSLNLSSYFALNTFAYINYYSDGVIDGIVDLPELPYGGLTYTVFLVFDNDKYIVDGTLRIAPYIITYVLTNSSAYAIDAGNYYIGVFVEGTQSAPGDYIVIEGHGFNLTNLTNFKVNVLGTNVMILDMSSHIDPSAGTVVLLAKLLDENTGTSINTGSGLLIVGEQGTPNTANVTFTVITGVPFKKVLFNPVWKANATSFYINHTKLGDPYLYFIVEYPLVNDTFTTTTWPYPTTMEVIGWDTTTFTLKFYNTFFNISYDWLTLDLTNGYNFTSLYGREIPFLAYGNYTLLEETLTSVNNRTVFTVHMGVDIDVSPCRDGTFNVTIVGAAPNTEYNLTFTYQIYDLVYGIVKYIHPEWTGTFTVTVVTDIYGKGSTSLLLRNIYTTDMVVNLTWDIIVYRKLNGTGTLHLWFKWNGTLSDITDNLTTPVTYVYSYKDTYYETFFYVNATYNVTITTVSTGTLYRYQFVISVPETVLPGDKIVVQIFPHRIDIWDLIIEPDYLYEEPELLGWYLYVRLVDPLTNNVVDKIEGYNVGTLVLEDLDEDGNNEIWFVTTLTAPFILGEDKTYRVDVKMFLAVLSPSTNITGYNATDYGCTVIVNINGTIYWNGYGSHLMLGGDRQIVTVLGVLEAKLDEIKEGVAVLEANISDLSEYIKVNITNLLNELNNTVAEIKNDIIVIKKDLATIIMNLSTIYDLVKEINGTLALVSKNVNVTITYCKAFNETLNKSLAEIRNDIRGIKTYINETLNKYLLWINGNVSSIRDLINQTLNKLDQVEANIEAYIDTKTYYLEGIIYDVSDDIITNISVKIDNAYNSLYNLINLRADELKLLINDTALTILATVNDTKVTITNKLNTLEMSINDKFATINASLITIKADLSTILSQLASLSTKVDNVKVEIINTLNNTITNAKSEVVTLLLNINDTVRVLLTGAINDINNALNNMKSYMEDQFSSMTTTLTNSLNDMKSTLTNMSNTLINTVTSKLDDMKSTMSDKIDTATSTLVTKIDTLDRRQADSFSSLNGSLTLFSSIILLLEVIIIALVGYGLVRRPIG